MQRKLTEIIDLYKNFELGVKVKNKDIPEKIKGYQLEKYFKLDDIKMNKTEENIYFNYLYKHQKSGEIIKIDGPIIKNNEKNLYKNYTNNEVIKEIASKNIMPHEQENIAWDYKLMEGE